MYGLSDLDQRVLDAKAEVHRAWQTVEEKRRVVAEEATHAAVRDEEQAYSAYLKKVEAKERADNELKAELERRVRGIGLVSFDRNAANTFDALGKDWVGRMAEQKALDATSGGATLVRAFYDNDIRQLPQGQSFIRSLIPVSQTPTGKVQYLRQTVATHNAAPVAPGAEKPESVYSVARIETEATTIAHVSEPLHRDLLADAEALATFVSNQLRLGVLRAEEDQILRGDGTGVELEGILEVAGTLAVYPEAGDTLADHIHRAITAVRLQFMEPDGIILSPQDWESIRLSKAEDSGEYLAGSILSGEPNQLWGKRVVATSSIAEGTAIVGDFATATRIWEREGARIEFTQNGVTAGGDDLFRHNLVRFRGESRLALEISRPAGIAICDLTYGT